MFFWFLRFLSVFLKVFCFFGEGAGGVVLGLVGLGVL